VGAGEESADRPPCLNRLVDTDSISVENGPDISTDALFDDNSIVQG
jgi:hypothetical protein